MRARRRRRGGEETATEERAKQAAARGGLADSARQCVEVHLIHEYDPFLVQPEAARGERTGAGRCGGQYRGARRLRQKRVLIDLQPRR